MTRVIACALFAAAAALLVMVWKAPIVQLNSAVATRLNRWQFPSLLRRQREIQRLRRLDIELIDSLGEMIMGLEAGLSFEAVLDAYSDRRSSVLGVEFRTILDDVRLGTSRLQALQSFERRNPTPAVRLFVSAVQQNSKIGAPLAATLRGQAEAARRQRRQAVEENAAKISLKMVFPTVFCILPVLMVVIVGPAVIRLVDSLPK
jgi:tight adherence protein C